MDYGCDYKWYIGGKYVCSMGQCWRSGSTAYPVILARYVWVWEQGECISVNCSAHIFETLTIFYSLDLANAEVISSWQSVLEVWFNFTIRTLARMLALARILYSIFKTQFRGCLLCKITPASSLYYITELWTACLVFFWCSIYCFCIYLP